MTTLLAGGDGMTILVATDFSPSAQTAARLGGALARRLSARLHIAHLFLGSTAERVVHMARWVTMATPIWCAFWSGTCATVPRR